MKKITAQLTTKKTHASALRVCHDSPSDHRARLAKTKPPLFQPIAGSFSPPPGTLEIGIGRQPDGFTCGTETFIGLCEFLRLPVRDPDDDDVESYKKKLKTSYKYGTDPADIAKVARKYLGIDAAVKTGLSVDDLDAMTRGEQAYVDEMSRGTKPHRPLSVAMVTYQAYVLPDHDKSLYFPRGRRGNVRRVLPIRKEDGSLIWENDWGDGHWSAVLRVVRPSDKNEKKLLGKIRREIANRPRADELLDGVVILGDPSNGEALSFIPIPEFEARWHDTDRDDKPRFKHAAVVLTVPIDVLREMQESTRRLGVPMFATVERNSVIYVP